MERWQEGQRGSQVAITRAIASRAVMKLSGKWRSGRESLQVQAHPGPWYILNALHTRRCIDDARCEGVQYWKPEDGRPDKVGEYRAVYGLRIDPAKVGGARIFRPWGWRVALIISEDLKQAIESAGLTGTRFTEV